MFDEPHGRHFPEPVPQKVSVPMIDPIPLDHSDVFLREALKKTS